MVLDRRFLSLDLLLVAAMLSIYVFLLVSKAPVARTAVTDIGEIDADCEVSTPGLPPDDDNGEVSTPDLVAECGHKPGLTNTTLEAKGKGRGVAAPALLHAL